MAIKQELILKQLEHLWSEHPSWTFGKLASVIIGLNDVDHQLMHISDEDLFRKTIALNRNPEIYRIKKLPKVFQMQTSDIVIRMSELIEDLSKFNHEHHKEKNFELVLAYALLIDELKYMKQHLEKIV